MRSAIFGGYDSFRCLAGECPATCCAGWNIRVDSIDYERFQVVEPEWLRCDILSNIGRAGEEYFFQHREDGRCAMLDRDGLCRIQKNTSEETLCNTCRKYPRLPGIIGGVLYLSMAASCPVISSYLVYGNVYFKMVDDSGESREITAEKMGLTAGAWKVYRYSRELAGRLWRERSDELLLYHGFEKMAAGILGIIAEYGDKGMTADLFEVLEEDVSEMAGAFVEEEREAWERISVSYMAYRIFSRKIEFPNEEDAACVRWVQAELFLVRTLAFCRYCGRGGLSNVDWQELLQRMYRFCAHGEKVVGAFGKLVQEFFSQDVLWSYLLL